MDERYEIMELLQKSLLINYYEGKDNKKIKNFLKEKCYLGI